MYVCLGHGWALTRVLHDYTANEMIVALIVVTKLLSVLLSSLDNTGFCSFLAKNYYHDSKDGDFGGKMALLSGLLSIFEETPTNDLLLFPVLIPMMVYAHRTYCLSYLLRT